MQYKKDGSVKMQTITDVLGIKTHTIVNQRNFLDTRVMTFDEWCEELSQKLVKIDMCLETLKKRDVFLEFELSRFFDSGRDTDYTAGKLFTWYGSKNKPVSLVKFYKFHVIDEKNS